MSFFIVSFLLAPTEAYLLWIAGNPLSLIGVVNYSYKMKLDDFGWKIGRFLGSDVSLASSVKNGPEPHNGG